MKFLLKNIKTHWKLLIIIALAAFLRFDGLTWCFPYTPHPDEYNMAAAITRLNWEEKFNPQFFAYGQFPLYLAYFSATIYNQIPWITIKEINIQEAVFFLRFWSAAAGVGTVYLVYLISRRLLTVNCSLLTAIFAAFTPGLIQVSHFGTTESLLSFFFLAVLLFSLKILEKPKIKYFIYSGIVLGLALGSKISALTFLAPLGMALLIILIRGLKKKSRPVKKIKNFFILAGKFIVTLMISFLLAILTSPYLLLAFKESRGTLLYEIAVANGTSSVFYTRQFLQTIPILFQFQKIFPHALGWPIFILGITGTILTVAQLIKTVRVSKLAIRNSQFAIILCSFLLYFLSQAFLFCKWTRFVAPVFAFFPIFFSLSLSYLSNLRYLRCLIVFLAILPGIFFSSIYFRPDIRFQASDWIFKNVPSGSKIIFDTGNVVDIPISPKNYTPPPGYNLSTVSFDFYHLDENPELFTSLLKYLETADYIFVPSRRIFKNHMRFPELFPKTTKYYELLFSGKLGFEEIKEFSSFSFLGKPLSLILEDENAEETFSVFDHPVIRIYKKVVSLDSIEYQNLFLK